MSNLVRWGRATLSCLVGLAGCDKFIKEDAPYLHDEIQETHRIGSTGDTFLQLVMEGSQTAPADLYWQVQTGSRKIRLNSLAQLEGRVTINRAEDALYILRIVSDNPHAAGDTYEVEIKPDDHGRFDSERGLPNHIPSAIYLRSGLKPATLQTTPSGFVITRWMFDYGAKNETEQMIEVRETMGRNGKYVRKILSSKPPPPIPEIRWMIPGRR